MRHATIILFALLAIGCRHSIKPEARVGAVCQATARMILLDAPDAPRTEMEIAERCTGILTPGERYEVRNFYRLDHKTYRRGRSLPYVRYGTPWVLLVSHDDPRNRGWVIAKLVAGERIR